MKQEAAINKVSGNKRVLFKTEIPSEWDVFELGELFYFKNGINAGKESYGKGVKFINVMEVIYHDFITTDMIPGTVQISDEQKELYLVKDGDVLFNRTSETTEEIGLSAVYNGNEDVVFGGFVIRGRPILNAIDPVYKRYCLRSSFVRNQIIKGGQGAVRTNIGQGDLSLVKIALPPIAQQKSIGQILCTIDLTIQKVEQLVNQKELCKKWLMQQLLTGKKRLKGFGGEWVTLKIKNIGIIPEKKPITKVENQKLLTVKLHTKGIEFNHRDIPVISNSGRPYFERNEGEILIGRQNIHNGGIGLLTNEFDGHICSNAISSFKVNDSQSTEFILFYLQYPSNYQRIEDYMGGTGQKELSEKQFLDIPIKLPKNKDEQTAIAQVLQAADKEISLLKLKAEKLREKKKGLMQQLLTGKIRIK